MEEKNLICICCPLGCPLTVTLENGEVISVTGNTCPRGAAYGRREVTNPTRIVTSTALVSGGVLPRKAARLSPSACCAGKCESGVSADAAGTGYYPEAYVAADSVPHPALSGSMGRDDCG